MRWLAVVAATVIALFGALFAVGYFFLPVKTSVTRTVTIDRPAGSVHALLENLRTFNEWSPWYAADPQAEYVIVGDAGVGQKSSWVSKVASVGQGTQRITRSDAPKRVDSIISFKNRGSANLSWTLAPAKKGVIVSWTMSTTCTPDPLRVACRYLTLIARGPIENDLDIGLERLKLLAEQLPEADFAALRPEFLRVEPMPFAYVENDVRREEGRIPEFEQASVVASRNATFSQRVATAIAQSEAAVQGALAASETPISGPPIFVTLQSSENQISFRVGFPFTGPGPANDPRVAVGQTPGGKAMRVTHVGPPQTLSDTYRLVDAYLRSHRLDAAGGAWEVYTVRTGDPKEMRTDIFVPLY